MGLFRHVHRHQHVRRLLVPAAPALEQEGYRWRDDDGSESTATFLAAQDVDITRVKNTNTRIRALVNATGDPASEQYQLEYRKVGATDYNKITSTS